MEAPWIFPDEATYALLGRSLWRSDSLSLVGGVTGGYSLFYPAVLGVPLSVLGPSSGLAVAQVGQALAMSSVALVVFAWGRRVMDETWALVAAALAVCIPGLAYSASFMTETLFYPVVTLALWALWRLLVEPSLARQGVFVGATAVAVLTRAQAVGLLAAALLAVALFCAFRRDATILRRSAPLLGLIAVAGSLALGISLVPGGWADIVGVYAAATGGYEFGASAMDIFWHAGGLFVIVVGVPLIALGILVAECARGRESDTGAALVATALAWTVVSLIEVGTFASRWVGHIAERDLITVAPPLLLVFALWLARGAPRPQPLTSVVALAVAVPALLLPVARFANQEAALDVFSFIPLWRLREATSSGSLQIAYALAVGLVVVVSVFARRRAGFVLVVVAATLVSASIVSSVEIQRLARADRTWVFSTTQPRWIDEVADGPVTYIYAETELPKALWQTLFWNERIDRVLQFDGTPPAAPVPTRPVAPRVGGLVLDAEGTKLRAGYVAAPSNIVLAGAALASYGPATDMPGMTLWQADSPLRIRWITSGVQTNGDIVGTARVEVLGCAQGHLSLTLLGKAGTPVQISVVGRGPTTVTPASGSVWSGDVPAPASADGTDLCVYEIDSPGLVGSTRIEFVPTPSPAS
ncbi:MAG: glycosyltransferase family 39 protein [Gaiellaceae bacterium]